MKIFPSDMWLEGSVDYPYIPPKWFCVTVGDCRPGDYDVIKGPGCTGIVTILSAWSVVFSSRKVSA